jgi:hypothetical protein
MKLCIEGDIYFIPKFHILETGTVKLSIETGLSNSVPWVPNSGVLYIYIYVVVLIYTLGVESYSTHNSNY